MGRANLFGNVPCIHLIENVLERGNLAFTLLAVDGVIYGNKADTVVRKFAFLDNLGIVLTSFLLYFFRRSARSSFLPPVRRCRLARIIARSYPIRTVIQFSICPSIGRRREGSFINLLINQLGTFSHKKRRKFCKLFVNGTMVACVLVKLFERKKRRSQRITPKAAPLYFGIQFLLSAILKSTIRNSNLCVTQLPVGIRVPLTRPSYRAR